MKGWCVYVLDVLHIDLESVSVCKDAGLKVVM